MTLLERAFVLQFCEISLEFYFLSLGIWIKLPLQVQLRLQLSLWNPEKRPEKKVI